MDLKTVTCMVDTKNITDFATVIWYFTQVEPILTDIFLLKKNSIFYIIYYILYIDLIF
jgi:hypothetical protein